MAQDEQQTTQQPADPNWIIFDPYGTARAEAASESDGGAE